uniref:Tetratricopeptide repeat protein n=1 Tax=Schlesneria paludicola TaxID=360056 RepID=A0A7C2P1Y9_9PLAN
MPSKLLLRDLIGARVVLIGRFAAMRRPDLVRQLRASGAVVGREVTPATTQVIVGAAGWPLRRNGRLPRGLLVARMLHARQAAPAVLDEASLYADGLPTGGVESQAPSEPDALSFCDHARARILLDLIAAGVSSRRLQRSLWQLGRWFPEARTSWERLSPTWDGGRLVVRLPEGGLVEPCGQRLFDFHEQATASTAVLPIRSNSPDELFRKAVAHEQQGELAPAEETYRELLRREGPDADVCFNLANVLVAQGHSEAALERLWQCVELTPRFAEAWHNLGTVAWELRRFDLAEEAFREALRLCPDFEAAQGGLHAVIRYRAAVQSASGWSRPTVAGAPNSQPPGGWVADHSR